MAAEATRAFTISGCVYLVMSVFCVVVNSRGMKNVRLRIYILKLLVCQWSVGP